MKPAYHLINFGVWKDKSEDDKVAAIKRAGYDAAESLDLDWKGPAANAKKRLAALEIKLAAMNFPALLMAPEDGELVRISENLVKVGEATGCDVCVAMTPRTNGKNIHSFGTADEHYTEAARRLNLVGRVLADGGVKLVIHNHIDHMSESAEEMDLLMNQTDEKLVGICFDTAHAVCAGEDPLAYAKRFKSRIRHLHLKDTKNRLHGRPYFFKNVFMPLGAGVIDFPAILAVLSDFQGWWTVELDASFSNGDPESEAKISLEYLKKNFG